MVPPASARAGSQPSPEALAALVKNEVARWTPILKAAGVTFEPGLVDELIAQTAGRAGTLPLERVRKHSVSEGVDFIATGAVSFDPSELLASPIFGQTLRELASQYDMVILDTAPVLSSPDAAVVGTHAAAVMVVVRSGMNTVVEIRETAKRLIQAGAPVDGVPDRRLLAEFPLLLVPKVIEGYTTDKVLTTERIRGLIALSAGDGASAVSHLEAAAGAAAPVGFGGAGWEGVGDGEGELAGGGVQGEGEGLVGCVA